jgi:heterotetrameric sarcosine oxidase gamma subunit
VSALSFLVADSEPALALARTPMERLAVAAGARMQARDGWNVAVAYDGVADGAEAERLARTVAFADRSPLTKLELQAEPATLARLITGVAGELEFRPGCAAQAGDGSWWCPVTPSRMLVLAEPAAGPELRRAVGQATTDAPGTVTIAELTSGLAALTLAGPEARELLARFCAIDVRPSVMPMRAFRPGSVARTPGYVLREREEELLLLVGWALGEYLWRVVADAAEHLGGGPVGADPLARHREAADA